MEPDQRDHDDDDDEQDKGSAPKTLIDAVLFGGERGTAAEHEIEDRGSYYYLVAYLLRMALRESHEVPMPDQIGCDRVTRTAQNATAWKNLYWYKKRAYSVVNLDE